jgi:hypothetical protein
MKATLREPRQAVPGERLPGATGLSRLARLCGLARLSGLPRLPRMMIPIHSGHALGGRTGLIHAWQSQCGRRLLDLLLVLLDLVQHLTCKLLNLLFFGDFRCRTQHRQVFLVLGLDVSDVELLELLGRQGGHHLKLVLLELGQLLRHLHLQPLSGLLDLLLGLLVLLHNTLSQLADLIAFGSLLRLLGQLQSELVLDASSENEQLVPRSLGVLADLLILPDDLLICLLALADARAGLSRLLLARLPRLSRRLLLPGLSRLCQGSPCQSEAGGEAHNHGSTAGHNFLPFPRSAATPPALYLMC